MSWSVPLIEMTDYMRSCAYYCNKCNSQVFIHAENITHVMCSCGNWIIHSKYFYKDKDGIIHKRENINVNEN